MCVNEYEADFCEFRQFGVFSFEPLILTEYLMIHEIVLKDLW